VLGAAGGGGFKEGKSRRVRYSFDSASSRLGVRRRGGRKLLDSVAVQSDSGDAGGG
jgi:hypothetical protein